MTGKLSVISLNKKVRMIGVPAKLSPTPRVPQARRRGIRADESRERVLHDEGKKRDALVGALQWIASD